MRPFTGLLHAKHKRGIVSMPLKYGKLSNVHEGMEGTVGDVWTWTAIDADSKLIVSWLVGARDADSANAFMNDVATRLTKRVQLTTDGLKAYLYQTAIKIINLSN